MKIWKLKDEKAYYLLSNDELREQVRRESKKFKVNFYLIEFEIFPTWIDILAALWNYVKIKKLNNSFRFNFRINLTFIMSWRMTYIFYVRNTSEITDKQLPNVEVCVFMDILIVFITIVARLS